MENSVCEKLRESVTQTVFMKSSNPFSFLSPHPSILHVETRIITGNSDN